MQAALINLSVVQTRILARSHIFQRFENNSWLINISHTLPPSNKKNFKMKLKFDFNNVLYNVVYFCEKHIIHINYKNNILITERRKELLIKGSRKRSGQTGII